MKHHWRIRRQTQPISDALQRWDRAYQYLLHWTSAASPDQTTNPQPAVTSDKEAPNASSSLCPRFDHQPGS